MKRKLITSTILVLLITLFSIPVVFANNEAPFNGTKDAIRNTVGGAENVVENTARDVSNGIQGMTNNTNNNNQNNNNNNNNNQSSRSDKNDNNRNNQSGISRTDNGNNGRYIATRTDATTFMGMTSNAWTWLILGIVGAAIIALVWYYTKSNTTFDNQER